MPGNCKESVWTNITLKESRSKLEESRVVLTLTSEKACLGVKSVGNKGSGWHVNNECYQTESDPVRLQLKPQGKVEAGRCMWNVSALKLSVSVTTNKRASSKEGRSKWNMLGTTKIMFKICPLLVSVLSGVFGHSPLKVFNIELWFLPRHWFWNKTHVLYFPQKQIAPCSINEHIGLVVYIKRN